MARRRSRPGTRARSDLGDNPHSVARLRNDTSPSNSLQRAPWRDPPAIARARPGLGRRSHAAVGLGYMNADGERDVVDKCAACLFGTPESGEQRGAKGMNCPVGDAGSRPIVELFDSWRLGIVGYGAEGRSRKVEMDRMEGLVDQDDGIALEVVEDRLPCPERTLGAQPLSSQYSWFG